MGLYIRNTVWWVKFKRDGRVIRESAETHDRKKAELVLRQKLAENQQRKLATKMGLAVPDDLGDAKLTLGAFLEKYEKHYRAAGGPALRKSRENSWRGDKAGLKCVLAFFERQGAGRVGKVTRRLAEAFRDYRATTTRKRKKIVIVTVPESARKKGQRRRQKRVEWEEIPISGATVNHDLRVGKAAWSYAVRMGYARENPFRGVKPIKLPRYDPRNLSEWEVRKVFDVARQEPLFPLFATAVYAGLREGELIALEWTDMDLKAAEIRVRCDETFHTKSRKPRVVPIAPELASVLEPLHKAAKGDKAEATGLCFPSAAGTPFDAANVRKVVKRIVRRAMKQGVGEFTCHDLRRTFASVLAARGVPTTRIRDYLGHASVATTEGYYLARGQIDPADVAKLSFGLTAPAAPPIPGQEERVA